LKSLQSRVPPCLNSYRKSVEKIIPGFGQHILLRSWGGTARASKTPTVLGVGFDGATSLALAIFCRQRGLSVLHSWPGKTSRWIDRYPSLYATHEKPGQCRRDLDQFNFSTAVGEGYNILFDEAVSHHFLDFFFATPSSKVLLAVHPSTERTIEHQPVELRSNRTFPALASCGLSTESLTELEAIELMRSHQDLVRCVVPPEQLLEVRLDNNNNTQISEFLGLGLRKEDQEAPWPQFRLGFKPSFKRRGRRGRRGHHHKDSGSGRTLAVCITGQLGRLELESKIDHLIKPAMKEGLRVVVLLVIDPRNETHFVHKGGLDVVIGPYRDFGHLRGRIPAPASVIYDPFIPRDYQIVPGYLAQLRKQPGNPRMRAFSHMRQWEALSRCATILKDLDPDVTIRLREDTYFLRNVQPQLYEHGVYVQSCRPCGGYNDKAAIAVGADVAKKYLTAPLKLMRSNFSHLLRLHKAHAKTPMGPEAVLKTSLVSEKIKVSALPAEKMAIAPARFSRYQDKYYYCFYRSVQECIPKVRLREMKKHSPRINGVANESVACTRVTPDPRAGLLEDGDSIQDS